MIYKIEHKTHYSYSQPAILSCNDVCLDLRATPGQIIRNAVWQIDPQPSAMRLHRDWFGNQWRTLAFEQPLRQLTLLVKHEVELADSHPGLPLSFTDSFGPAAFSPGDRVQPYLWPSPMVQTGAEFKDYARPSFGAGRHLLESVMDLTTRIFKDFKYVPSSTVIGTTTRELLTTRRGVCQDYAHFALAALRSCGIAARYVSGYLNTIPKPGQEKVYGADASHAWISVWDNQQGWVDFDPTNGVAVGNGHVTIAWGRDYGDVTPLRGVVLGGGNQILQVMVDVRSSPGPQ